MYGTQDFWGSQPDRASPVVGWDDVRESMGGGQDGVAREVQSDDDTVACSENDVDLAHPPPTWWLSATLPGSEEDIAHLDLADVGEVGVGEVSQVFGAEWSLAQCSRKRDE